MNYIVLDMEWNQPFSKAKKCINGVELSGDIIQIGAVRLSNEFEPVGSFESDVSPRFYTRLNRHVREITGLDESELRGRGRFPEVYDRFRRFCGEDYRFITWGCDDLPMLCENIRAYGIDDTPQPVYNLQTLFNVQITHESRQWSLEAAMERLGISQSLRAHNALCDAVNTAKIVQRLDMHGGLDMYLQTGGRGCIADSPVCADGFRTARDAFRSRAMTSLSCPYCKRELESNKWVGAKNRRMTISACPEHGMLRFRTEVTKTDSGYRAARVCGFADLQTVEMYNGKIRELQTV